jgi:hypothetical protein
LEVVPAAATLRAGRGVRRVKRESEIRLVALRVRKDRLVRVVDGVLTRRSLMDW